MRTLGVAVLAALFATAAIAADEPDIDLQGKKPDASAKFSGRSVAAGVGASWGSGTLSFKGKQYPFRITGLAVGDVGVTDIDASAEVYNLRRLEDFAGNYAAVGAGAAAGGGREASLMRNQHGVVMEVSSTTQGIRVKAGPEGVKVEMGKSDKR